jgi:CRISPR/Cas system-associated exonuclease Cas4 (RecB family)
MIDAAHSTLHQPVNADLAAVLSPSQVRCFMECQTRWWFKYGLKCPDPPTANLALGRAVHAALGHNFAQKMETYEDLPAEGVQALFRESWRTECEQVEFQNDEDPRQLGAIGESLVAKYMDERAPLIEPAAVELRVAGQIGGVSVQGWIDILDVDGLVVEIKTGRARPSSIEPMHRFQAATYCQLTPGASGKGRIDTLVKTKIPQIISQSFELTEGDLTATQSLYPLIQGAMRVSSYVPNRLAMSCSRRSCAYWRNCEQQWGGEVPEK